MKSVLIYVALGLVIQLHAQTTTITFDGPPAQPVNTQFAIQQYSEAGFVFKPLGPLDPAPPYRLARNGGGIAAYPADGSAYLQTLYGGSLEFFQTNGSTFNLVSVDLAEYSTVFPRPATITFTGTKADGTIVTTSFVTDGIIDGTGPLTDFQTFFFGTEFSDLLRVEVPTIVYSLDNLRVSFGPYSLPERTVVNVVAVDSEAREPSVGAINSGQFAIRRTGNLAYSIPVRFPLTGSASNGVDYSFITNQVLIPAGSNQVLVTVSPRADELAEGTETVVLSLESPVCIAIDPPPPECYLVGPSNSATVFIADTPSATNHPPTVQINQPLNESTFNAPAMIILQAFASDAEDGNDLRVEFFSGTNRLGVGTFVPTLCPSPYCPYFALTWSNVLAGTYSLTARATDKAGATTISTAVRITVISSNPPPPDHTIVSVIAIDSEAAESGPLASINPGRFAIRRSGNLATSIPVSFSLSGSASNGIDYVFIANHVVIPAGSTQALVTVQPLEDGLAEGTESVVLTLEWPICIAIFPPPPECYTIGLSGAAEVLIRDWPATNPSPVESTIITVVATHPQTREPGLGATEVGQFSIRRNGNLNTAIPVFFTLAGTAANGLDYTFLSNQVVIPAGATQALVNVVPLSDSLVEGTETVALTLQPPVCAAIVPAPPGCYEIRAPSEATVFITDSTASTNRAPIVSITMPTNGATFSVPANILIVANANDPDGYETVSTVEFFAGDHSLGIRTNFPTANLIGPFFLIWSNVTAGSYNLRAKATDNTGASTMSATVVIHVGTTPNTSNLVIRFEPASLPHGSKLITNYTESGFFFTTPNKLAHTDGGTSANLPASEGAFLGFLFGCSPLTISNLLGQPFDLLSVDLAEYSTVYPFPRELTVRGYKPGGSSVSVVLRLDGVVAFQTFTFDTQFSGLIRVEVTPDLYSLDNLRVALRGTNSPTHPPEPRVTVLPQCFSEVRTNGCRLLLIAGTPVTCVVECSVDLLQWTPIYTNTVCGGAVEFCDREASGGALRFYRVRPE